MKIKVLLFAALISTGVCYAQTEIENLMDSLEQRTSEDTTRIFLLLKIAHHQWRSSPEDQHRYGNEALILAKKLNRKLEQARAQVAITNSFITRGDYDKAMENALKTLEASLEAGFRKGEAHAYKFMGLIQGARDNFEEAVKRYQEALTIYTAIADTSAMISTLNNLGISQMKIGNVDEGFNMLNKALANAKARNNNIAVGSLLNNIGTIYLDEGRVDEALDAFKESLEIRRQAQDNIGEIITMQNLGEVYIKWKNFETANQYLLGAFDLADKYKIEKEKIYIYEYLVELEKERKNYALALEYNEKYIQLKDSLFNETKSQQIAELETKFETQKKEKEIAKLELDNQKRAWWQRLMIVGLAMVFTIMLLGYFFYSYRNRNNRQLLEAQEAKTLQWQKMDRMKSRFFTNISHEFRTPLSLILGPVQTLLSGIENQGHKQHIQMIQRNAQRLLKLVNQLLELSKIEAGKVELKASMGNIVPFSRSIFFGFHSLAEGKNLILNFDSQNEEIILYFDKDKLEKILNNLISNAIKFSLPNGKVSLSIERQMSGNERTVVILVKDIGPGIPSEMLPYIFDRFVQADNADTTLYDGTGVGLALVKELVELHHGKIEVASTYGKGTIFKIYLPMGKDHLSEEQIVNISKSFSPKLQTEVLINNEGGAKLVPSGDDSCDRPMILIVEDNVDLQEYIRGSFADEYQIKQAFNGIEGLEKAIKFIPDLIISDVMMPKMDGLTLCGKLKMDNRTSHIPVILLTAKNTEFDKFAGLERQADDYLIKPFNTLELVLRVKNLIALRRKLQEKYKESIIVKPKEIEVNSIETAFLEKLKDVLEAKISDELFSVEKLSYEMGMSRVHLHRKLSALIGCSPSQFIRQYRLHRAMDLLRKNAASVSEIAYQVGFSSPTYFTKCFSDNFGYSPKKVRATAKVD